MRAWEDYPVVWRACKCRIWPLALGVGSGRCGACGHAADIAMPAPSSGKAEPLGPMTGAIVRAKRRRQERDML